MFFRNIPDPWKMTIVEIENPSRITSLSKIYSNIIFFLKIRYILKDETLISPKNGQQKVNNQQIPP